MIGIILTFFVTMLVISVGMKIAAIPNIMSILFWGTLLVGSIFGYFGFIYWLFLT